MSKETGAKFLIVLWFAMVFCIPSHCVQGQSTTGTYNNYSGSMGLAINPSLMTTSNLYADIGLSVDVMGCNNYFSIQSKDVWRKIIDSTYKFSYPKMIDNLPRLFEYDFKYGERVSSRVNAVVDVTALSGMYNVNGKDAVGFYVRSRVNAGADNFPSDMLEMFVVGNSYTYKVGDNLLNQDSTHYYNSYLGNHSCRNVNAGVMSWSEVGLSYSRAFDPDGYNRFDVGGSVKLALGHGAIAASVDKMDYERVADADGHITDTVWGINAMKGGLVFSLPINYDEKFIANKKMNPNLLDRFFLGLGGGLDIGFTYTHVTEPASKRRVYKACQVKPIEYDWRIGFSILDLGAVRYGGDKARKTDVDATDKMMYAKTFDELNTLNDVIEGIDSSLGAESKNESFWVGMPTSLSLQFDYTFRKKWHLSAVVIQPVNIFKYHVTRDAQISISPRFESRRFCVSIPVSWINYERFVVGTELRAGFFTIGTQNLLNLVGVGTVYGLDLYVSLKFNLHKGRCFSVRDACWGNDLSGGNTRR